ncbi:MAG: hypothetical protein WCA49_13305 [Candidatus Sulfotelmatobacter sp.]
MADRNPAMWIFAVLVNKGVLTPVLAKHSKSFSLIDCISVGVDRMQRNFEPMRKQVEAWQRSELTDVTAKVVIYEAFVEAKLEAPKHLARTVARPVLRAEVRGIPTTDDLESVECVYVGIQGTRSQRRNWVNSWKPGFPNRSNCGAVFGSRLFLTVNSKWLDHATDIKCIGNRNTASTALIVLPELAPVGSKEPSRKRPLCSAINLHEQCGFDRTENDMREIRTATVVRG